ncbi:hypothetical protein HOLleu_01923 [Holothuria leucospilota]|uniref:Uncharacterized protein n=1 Tax=Holothuria leucospilota TaxID=206669 RepID=A0A9Q1CQX5_HOLLE|nr:hypothetical protein HOLleu_01923 [Holothuria leucospilota]
MSHVKEGDEEKEEETMDDIRKSYTEVRNFFIEERQMKRLDERYGTRSKLGDVVIGDLVKHRVVKEGDDRKLVEFIDLVEASYRNLERAGLQGEMANSRVIGEIEKKLPEELFKRWARHMNDKEIKQEGRMQGLLAFLECGREVALIKAYGMDVITKDLKYQKIEHLARVLEIEENKVTRPVGKVDLLIGLDHADLHPQKVRAVDHLVLFEGPFGCCLEGRHPVCENEVFAGIHLTQVGMSVDQFLRIESLGGVAREVPEAEVRGYEGPVHYIAHHAVRKPESDSTPLRIVFNSSANYKGPVLNDYWAKGPDLNDQLIAVMMRFRKERVALVGDIRKMYHSVGITLLDQHCHRFLWRGMEVERPLKTYCVTSVNFGDKPAATIAICALRKTAEMSESEFPEAADTLKRNVYMDDFLDS